MKTPEQMATDWYIRLLTEEPAVAIKEAYQVGYQAAKDEILSKGMQGYITEIRNDAWCTAMQLGQQSQWISVKEQNPEARRMVLVCHKTFGVQIGFIDDNHARPCRNRWIVYVREFEEDASNHVPKTGKYEHIEITHWMPLPSVEGLKHED